MSTLALLSMDAGQTGTKVRLRWADGSSRDDLLPGVLTDRPLAPQPVPVTPPGKSSPLLMVLLLGLLAFGLFFAAGYFLGHALIH